MIGAARADRFEGGEIRMDEEIASAEGGILALDAEIAELIRQLRAHLQNCEHCRTVHRESDVITEMQMRRAALEQRVAQSE